MSQEHTALFTIFGATGDLATRKLYPSLFRLFRKKEVRKHFAVIGTARRDWTHDYYRQIIKDTLKDLHPTQTELDEFTSHFYYQAHNVNDTQHYHKLKQLSEQLDEKYHLAGNRLFYLAMSPQFFGVITKHLRSEDIVTQNGFNRLVIEKPFGSDYKSAKKLNEEIRYAFDEEQIYRIDHYLGKEMIQNITAIRFGNPVFESLWNTKYIDNVQITLSESLGVEDRGGYYDHSGALKDMVQNHVLQVLSLLAMEPPTIFNEKTIRQEKVKALQAVRIYKDEEVRQSFIRGQYGANEFNHEHYPAYRSEANVAPDSQIETFVAGKFMIDNIRWSGVPFYIRTGKRMTEKGTRINIIFKPIGINIFRSNEEDAPPQQKLPANVLTIYIQPTEGFALTLNGKEIGSGFGISPVKLDYRQSDEMSANTPEAYEKLLLDCLKGESTNFTHWDEVATSWRIVDVIRRVWDNETLDIPIYPSGTMGPKEAFDFIQQDKKRDWYWQPDIWYKERGLL